MDKHEMMELAEIVATAVVNTLEQKGLVNVVNVVNTKANVERSETTAYQKTEKLLFNYKGFKRIVEERKEEIADLRKYGVPGKSSMSGGERVQTSRTVQGIVLPEESVEDAVRAVEASVQGTVRVIALIDKCMDALKRDPYYKVLEMRYFEGRTLEDIGVYFSCDHSTISRQKNRLVKELSMRLFPDEVIKEYMK